MRLLQAIRVLGILSLLSGAGLVHAQIGGTKGHLYFVSSTGNDLNSGRSSFSAWRTIARVNQQVLAPSDSVYFQAGAAFSGTIVLDPGESGTPSQPITFGSFGPGSATILAGLGSGFDLVDVSGIRITDLIVAGSGSSTNAGIGISFYVDLPGDVKLPWIRIDSCRVTGFRRGGISIGGYNGRSGFEDVRVEGCRLDHNGNNGMAVWGFYDTAWGQTLDDYAHRSIYVGHNVFESNWGDTTLTNKHTGSGIEVAQAAEVLIELNEAFDNGRLNSYTGGGPVGIWMWDVLDGTIQYNESHHNSSGTVDGGGFDLDGGCVQCTIQYNYSHDNDGPGFLIAQFASGARPMSDATVRYNVSERDGGRGGSGALQLWNGDQSGPAIQRALFHNNTVFVETKSPWVPRGFRAFGSGAVSFSGFADNIFYSRGSFVWLGDQSLASAPLWLGNLYFADGGPFIVRDTGVSYLSLDAWRTATGHEVLSGQPTGFQGDPLLASPGNGGTLGDPDALATLDAYRLQVSSPVLDLGLSLPSFGIPVGGHDFYGVPVPAGAGFAIGASEGP